MGSVLLFDAGDDSYHPSLILGGYTIGEHEVEFPAGMGFDPTFVYLRFGGELENLNGKNGVVRLEGPRERVGEWLTRFEEAYE